MQHYLYRNSIENHTFQSIKFLIFMGLLTLLLTLNQALAMTSSFVEVFEPNFLVNMKQNTKLYEFMEEEDLIPYFFKANAIHSKMTLWYFYDFNLPTKISSVMKCTT